MFSTRREFLSFAAALGLSDVLASSAVFVETGQIRVRENIRIFAQDQSKVDALRLAVKTMKERSRAQPDDTPAQIALFRAEGIQVTFGYHHPAYLHMGSCRKLSDPS